MLPSWRTLRQIVVLRQADPRYGVILHHSLHDPRLTSHYSTAMVSRDLSLYCDAYRNPDVLFMVIVGGFALPLALIDRQDELVTTGDVLWLEEGPFYPIKDIAVHGLSEDPQ